MKKKELVSAVVTNDLYPNMVFDEKATQQKRDEVAAMVTPIEYKKGRILSAKANLLRTTNMKF